METQDNGLSTEPRPAGELDARLADGRIDSGVADGVSGATMFEAVSDEALRDEMALTLRAHGYTVTPPGAQTEAVSGQGQHFAESLDTIGDAGLTRLMHDVFPRTAALAATDGQSLAATPYRLSTEGVGRMKDAAYLIEADAAEIVSLVESATPEEAGWLMATQFMLGALRDSLEQRQAQAERDAADLRASCIGPSLSSR